MDDNMKDKKTIIKDVVLLTVILAMAIIFSLKFSILHVRGDSMNPTYKDKDIILLSKQSKLTTDNVAVFLPPDSWRSGNDKFIKRIVALEGDTVHIDNETMSVNGEFVSNITQRECSLEKEISFKLDKGEVFLVGDNHYSSNDGLNQLCNGNDEFLINEDSVIFNGEEIYVITGGLFNG